jgi:hypothetical protein
VDNGVDLLLLQDEADQLSRENVALHHTTDDRSVVGSSESLFAPSRAGASRREATHLDKSVVGLGLQRGDVLEGGAVVQLVVVDDLVVRVLVDQQAHHMRATASNGS